MGPFDAWPTGVGGFEHFYGFIGGEAHQWYPAIYDATVPVEPSRTPEQGYHFMADMTDEAVNSVRQEKALIADRPFFMYFARGAAHAPHHMPEARADNYTGCFDAGWDAQREQTFARQKKLGVIPPDAELTRRHDEIQPGTTCPRRSSPCCGGRWRSTPASWNSTPTMSVD